MMCILVPINLSERWKTFNTYLKKFKLAFDVYYAFLFRLVADLQKMTFLSNIS